MSKNIDDYKDRLGSPMGVVRLDPKTHKPMKQKKTVKKGKRK